MCDHANDAEARRCECTGYGMGDPLCRCGRGRKLHRDGTGACRERAARCHEFVLQLTEPMLITDDHIASAAAAIVADVGTEAAGRLALAALSAGRESARARDTELERVRRDRDRLISELTKLREEMARAHTAGSPVGLDGDPDFRGDTAHVDQRGLQPSDPRARDHGMAGRTAGGMAVYGL